MTLVNTEIVESDVLNYEIHPVAALFPFIEGGAFSEFVEDIRANGQREPVVLDGAGRLLDGRNRARACQVLGIDVKETRYSGDDAEAWIISHNVHRRHLTESQRAMIAARLANLHQGQFHGNQYASGLNQLIETTKTKPVSVADAADALSVGSASVGRAKAVLNSGDVDLIKSVESGQTTVNKAAQIARGAAAQTAASNAALDAAALTRDQRADLIAELANQGYSSRQMPSKVGVSEEAVRKIARDYDIEIPADRYVVRTRRINSSQIVERTATALEGLVSGVDLIEYDDVDPATASQWADSLSDSLKKLQRFATQIRKATQ